ncbi:MAG: aminotransferase class I/II-fold pyridoxal phosphate-dependent enzyme, partial [Chlamydiota bacterium]|nr:aminotransferase class I/II-fold pyridoxal phosphate-dependent enzyme [Chlamydiota bacterium]
PYFVMYKHLAKLLGAKPVFVDTYPDFQISAEKIEPLIGPRTKMIVLNSPSNPTGAVIRENALKDIAILAKQKNILVLSDEIYDAFSYDRPCPSIARYLDNTLLLSGFSKTYAMTGWRIGYAAGPSSVIQAMTKLQQYTFVCAPSIAQKMALEALKTDITSYIDDYRTKRDLIYHGLKDHFNVVKPEGAFYVFPEAPGRNAEAFVNKAIANNVLIIPGNVFSEKNTHFRISFAADHDTIQKGIDILINIAHDK